MWMRAASGFSATVGEGGSRGSAAATIAITKPAPFFYAGRVKLSLADAAPPPIELASRIPCPLLGIFGNDDQSPSPEDVNDYEAALQAAGVPVEFHRYDGAGHGFQDFTNAERFRESQSDDAWQKVLAFLERQLR